MTDLTNHSDGQPTERLTYKRWVNELEEGRLLGQQCQDCDHETAAPKAACAVCGSRSLRTVELPETGTVYSVTTIHVPPEGFEEPYNIGLVAVGNARVTARIDGEVTIEDAVVFDGTIDTPAGTSPVFVPTQE
jgi:uncharacterized OB-fold protein